MRTSPSLVAVTDEPPPEPTAGEPTSDEPASYAAADAELRAILEALEADAVDVDQLSARVARARFLIAWCRERVQAAELQVTQLTDAAEG